MKRIATEKFQTVYTIKLTREEVRTIWAGLLCANQTDSSALRGQLEVAFRELYEEEYHE